MPTDLLTDWVSGIREKEASRTAAMILVSTTGREELSFIETERPWVWKVQQEKIQVATGSLRRGVEQLDA